MCRIAHLSSANRRTLSLTRASLTIELAGCHSAALLTSRNQANMHSNMKTFLAVLVIAAGTSHVNLLGKSGPAARRQLG